VLASTRGKAGIMDLFRRIVRWRVGVKWYAAALLLPIAVTLTATAINVRLLGAHPSTSAAELGGWSSLVPTYFSSCSSPDSPAPGRSQASAATPCHTCNAIDQRSLPASR
jgi:hypothetical protein